MANSKEHFDVGVAIEDDTLGVTLRNVKLGTVNVALKLECGSAPRVTGLMQATQSAQLAEAAQCAAARAVEGRRTGAWRAGAGFGPRCRRPKPLQIIVIHGAR